MDIHSELPAENGGDPPLRTHFGYVGAALVRRYAEYPQEGEHPARVGAVRTDERGPVTSLLDGLDDADRGRLKPAPAAFVAPMLATLTADRFSDPDWIFERKLDGVRAIAVRDGSGASLWSRNEKPMDATYPELVDAVAAHVPAGTVLDGEIVAFDGRADQLRTPAGPHRPARPRRRPGQRGPGVPLRLRPARPGRPGHHRAAVAPAQAAAARRPSTSATRCG